MQHKIICKIQSRGFTLIEVMIVLAISSLLAVILIGLYSNQRGRAQFADATESVVSKLQSTKTEVSSGFSTGTGTNPNRIFFGKAVTFNPDSSTYTIQSLTAANSDSLSSLAIANQTQATIPWGVVFEQADNDNRIVVFTRSLADAQLRTYIFPAGTNILSPANYNSSPASQALLRFIEDPNDSASLRSNIIVTASSSHISSHYEN